MRDKLGRFVKGHLGLNRGLKGLQPWMNISGLRGVRGGGDKLTEEHKRKLSLAHKGKKFSEEHLKNMSLSRLGKKRGPMTEETKQKISIALTGKPSSRKGIKRPEVSGKNHPNYGKHLPKETREKIGHANKGKVRTLVVRLKISKSVKNILTPKLIRKMLSFRSPNKAEQTLNRILKTNFPKEWKFVGDGKVVIERKNPDFININGKKLIIDLFGKRWHEESEVEPRIKTFARYGYKTLIIWDYELKDEGKLMQKIKMFQEESFLNVTRE